MPRGHISRAGEAQPYQRGHHKGEINQTPQFASSVSQKIPKKDETE